MSGGRNPMTLDPVRPRACKTASRNNDLYDRKIDGPMAPPPFWTDTRRLILTTRDTCSCL